jgi:hypothetical protein
VDTKAAGVYILKGITMENIYIVISIVTLALIAIFALATRAKGKQPRRFSKLATLGMYSVVLGILFGNGELWIGYSFMGVGVILAVIDLIRNLKKQ